MHKPPHPGEVIKVLCLEPLGLTVTQAAEALGVSRKTLSAILNGRAGITPEMAVRLSIASDTHIGSNFDDFLREEHLLEVAQATAVNRVLAFQIAQRDEGPQANQVRDGQADENESRSVGTALRSANRSVTVSFLERAAAALGKKRIVELA